MDIIAHYLEIDWDSPGRARHIEVSTYPIEIETDKEGNLHAEVAIFRSFAPWVGLRLSDRLADFAPATIDAEGERHSWLKVLDNDGGAWWIFATAWSKPSQKHISEMHRSFGSFRIELGPSQTLLIDAVATELDRAHVQEYLDDFQDELVCLAIGKPIGASGSTGSSYSNELIEALSEFADVAGRVLEHPAKELGEVTAPALRARIRPNSETFRFAMRRPDARHLPGRTAHETADIPENRYVRGLIQHCRQLAHSLARATSRQAIHHDSRARRENTHGERLLGIQTIEVDQHVFDNQLRDISRRIDNISAWTNCEVPSTPNDRRYIFSIGSDYLGKGGGFLYNNLENQERYQKYNTYNISVATLPEGLHDLVREARNIDKRLSLELLGTAVMQPFVQANGKRGRRAIFNKVTAVKARSPVLDRRVESRLRYERKGWHREISQTERREYAAEARAAQKRAAWFQARSKEIEAATIALTDLETEFASQDNSWMRLDVGSITALPNSLRFLHNPSYAKVLAAFQKVRNLQNATGLNKEALEVLGRINVLHASALYERWCLVKILAVLIQDFGFIPEPGWLELISKYASSNVAPDKVGFAIELVRGHPRMTARLEVEPVLANARRPDFRLRFTMNSSDSEFYNRHSQQSETRRSIFADLSERSSGLVMDAKFRTKWKRDELAEMVKLLVEIKEYGQDGDRVFVLHPSKKAIVNRTSPLAWSSHCDYGHNHPTGHAHGSIQLSAAVGSPGASTVNLRRLIALELQKVFPEPVVERLKQQSGEGLGLPEEESEVCSAVASFCVSCGTAHDKSDVTPGKTERGNTKWFFRCSGCSAWLMRTPCFGCGAPLFKNGLQMTYHLTIADQLSNVVCPDCGVNF